MYVVSVEFYECVKFLFDFCVYVILHIHIDNLSVYYVLSTTHAHSVAF